MDTDTLVGLLCGVFATSMVDVDKHLTHPGVVPSEVAEQRKGVGIVYTNTLAMLYALHTQGVVHWCEAESAQLSQVIQVAFYMLTHGGDSVPQDTSPLPDPTAQGELFDVDVFIRQVFQHGQE